MDFLKIIFISRIENPLRNKIPFVVSLLVLVPAIRKYVETVAPRVILSSFSLPLEPYLVLSSTYLGVGRIVSVVFVERVGDVYFPSGDGV